MIKELVILNGFLRRKNIRLVIEITEREFIFCGKCPKIEIGLEVLIRSGVILAADDYNTSSQDIREREIVKGLYKFVKIEYEGQESLRSIISEIESLHQGAKVIIERVEDKKFIDEINKTLIGSTYYMQGYAFNNIIKI
ncbi:hypothetical protein J4N45_04960 [Vibrio sp. SCSIO 43140]|uniref:hypothetical protein n=1 Tax=Vibrio sp. SCSIO 43140 TaxID=2819100 RepID=UPI0020753AA5|nr:hypothetical protein [Vibrio sp. SCSIO 43140]USD61322.1 hypothetical protein J4N45_04960 [Vibrio sp. SCSIO 43140]